MTHPCGTPNCNHKADAHVRGRIITTEGKTLRPYTGQCKIERCNCKKFTKQTMITKEMAQEIIQLTKIKWNTKLPKQTRQLAAEKLKPILNDLRLKLLPGTIKTIKSNGCVILA